MRSSLLVAFALTLGACKAKDEPAAAKGAASADPTPAAAPASDEGEAKADTKQAIAVVNAIQGEQSGDARSKSCAALRTVAENFNDCADCQAPLIKVTTENPGGDLGDCYLEWLPKVNVKTDEVCGALVASLQKSKYGTHEIGAITQQGAGCKSKFDDVIAHEEKRFEKFADAYKDVGGAELLYLQRLAEHMTPEQKRKLSAAAKTLAAKAKAKKSKLEEDAQKLAALK
jgi:hypothetical protein